MVRFDAMPVPVIMSAIIGVLLVIRGWRGRRVDRHPVCRRCGFDLEGLGSTRNCPECGHETTRPRIGNRRRRVPVIVAGVIFLLPPIWYGAWWIGGVNVIEHKPFWMLLGDARSGRASVQNVALDEIQRRYETDALSDAQIAELIDEAIDILDEDEWHQEWSALLDMCVLSPTAPPDLLARYTEAALDVTLDVRPRVLVGHDPPARLLVLPGRLGPDTQVDLFFTTRVLIDDVERPDLKSPGRRRTLISKRLTPLLRDGLLWLSETPSTTLEPGPHTYAMDVEMQVGDVTFTRRVEAPFEVVEAGGDPIELVTDEDLSLVFADVFTSAAVRVRTIERANRRERTHLCSLTFGSVPMPIDVAGRVVLLAEDGTRFEGAPVSWASGYTQVGSHHVAVSAEDIAARVRVLIVPEPDIARRTIGMTRIHGREIDLGWVDVLFED